MSANRSTSDEPDDLMARLERSLQPGGWRERVGCTCSPGDGSEVCPREEECMQAWSRDRQLAKGEDR